MLQLSITLLFAFAGAASLAVVGRALGRAWNAAGELRAAIAQWDEVQPVLLRTVSIERRTATVVRFTPAARTRRMVPAPCALRVAA